MKFQQALISASIFLILIGCSEAKKASGVIIRTEKNHSEFAVVVKLKDSSLISRTYSLNLSFEKTVLCTPGIYVKVNYRDSSIIDFESFSEVPYDDRPSIYSFK